MYDTLRGCYFGSDLTVADGVRTNGVVAEVPQFRLMNFHGEM